jgi:ferritin-like metal-binding protein YciE
LLALCGSAGIAAAKAPLEESLKEEQRMASWIDSNVETITMEYLQYQQRLAA